MERIVMSHNLGNKLVGLALAAVAVGAFMAPAAQADPITFYNDAGNQSTPRFTIGCGSANGDCSGLLQAVSDNSSPPSWSSTIGQMLAIPAHGNSPKTEMQFVNTMLGTNFNTNSGNLSSPSGSSASFTADAGYFVIKIGNTKAGLPFALLQNISGDNVDVFFSQAGQGGGLSHYITFGPALAGGDGDSGGTATDVPEPGVLGIFGLGLLLAGFGYRLRRREPA